MDLLWCIFHISHHRQFSLLSATLAMSHGNTWHFWNVYRCMDLWKYIRKLWPKINCRFSSLLALCPLTTNNVCFLRVLLTQLWMADNNLGLIYQRLRTEVDRWLVRCPAPLQHSGRSLPFWLGRCQILGRTATHIPLQNVSRRATFLR